LAVVLFFSAMYSIHKLFPKDPSVVISANRGAPLDAALESRVVALLKAGVITPKRYSIEGNNLLVRLSDATVQAKAADLIRPALAANYTVALNLATTVPDWLQAIRAKPMSLGLDLQGGIQFLMEVDQKAAVDKRHEAFVDEIRAVLRENQIAYSTVARSPAGVQVELRRPEDRNRARNLIAQSAPELQLTQDPAAANRLLAVVPAAEIKRVTDNAIEQNMTTLRNRINALGVAEPVVQRQGQSRIAVQLPGLQDTVAAKKLIGATATLEYRAVVDGNAVVARDTGVVPPDARLYFMRELGADGKPRPILLTKRTIATGDQLVNASAQMDTTSGTPAVSVELNKLGGVAQQHLDAVAHARDAGEGDLVLAQGRADGVDVAFAALLQRRLVVHLEQEVHAALQVQAHRHRLALDGLQPLRHGAGQVERDVVGRAQLGADEVGCLRLVVDVVQAHDERFALDRHRLRGQLVRLHQAVDASEQRLVDFTAAVGGNLHRRVLGVQVRDGIDRAEQQHDRHHHVFPACEFKHGVGPGMPPAGACSATGAGSGRLQRALGQDGLDRGALHLHAHALGNLDGDEVLAQFVDAAGDAAVGDHLVALGEFGDQLAMFLRALHLRADHQEVHDAEQRHHHHDAGHGAGRGAGRGRLGRRRGDEEVEQGHGGIRGRKHRIMPHQAGSPALRPR
jgi:hypothetical protein